VEAWHIGFAVGIALVHFHARNVRDLGDSGEYLRARQAGLPAERLRVPREVEAMGALAAQGRAAHEHLYERQMLGHLA
jgi:hypothetical protein